ncbi:uncharacterized protein LOC135344285 isoform X2 [Halichondria panicea]
MVSAMNQPTRTSTLVLPVDQSLNGAVVTCNAGSLSADPQAGNLTIQVIGPPSTPTVDSMEYSVGDSTTGRFRFLVSSSGRLGTEVAISASVVGGSGTVVVTDNSITVIGLSYTRSHTVSIVATSAVCPGVLNNTDVSVMFNIASPVLTQPNGSVVCSNPSLPISGSWTLMEGVQSSSNPAAQLTPPLNTQPTITYTSAGGLSGSAVFVPDLSYQLTDTVENDVYTFTVNVTNVAGTSREVSEGFFVTPFVVDNSTLETMNCLTFSLGQNCASEQSGNFIVRFEQGNGVCRNLSDFSTSTIQLMPRSACAPVASSTNLCYHATLMYNGIIIDTQTNLNFNTCPVSALSPFMGSGVSMQLDREVTNGTVSHITTATLSCTLAIYELIGSPQITCLGGTWEPAGMRSCVFAVWLIVVIILALAFAIGIICGVLTARYLTSLLNGLVEKKWWAILAVIFLMFLFGFGVGVLFYMCCCQQDSDRESKPRDSEKLTESTSSPPPPDSLYADPKSIEHQAAPGTEDQYTMVDIKGKKNTKPKPTPPEALYQDPSTIEHETAVSGDTYAVVDKPKRSSKKKGGPDVIPPASEGLTYADIDLSTKRPKPGSDQQAAQQPGEYPVEYSSVEHGSTS